MAKPNMERSYKTMKYRARDDDAFTSGLEGLRVFDYQKAIRGDYSVFKMTLDDAGSLLGGPCALK